MAVNFRDVWASTRGFAGEIVIETNVTFETVSVVDWVMAPQAATMVVLPAVKLVTVPTSLMEATTGFDELQSTDLVIS